MIFAVLLLMLSGTAMGLLFAGALCRSGQIEDRMRGWHLPDSLPEPRAGDHDRVPAPTA